MDVLDTTSRMSKPVSWSPDVRRNMDWKTWLERHDSDDSAVFTMGMRQPKERRQAMPKFA